MAKGGQPAKSYTSGGQKEETSSEVAAKKGQKGSRGTALDTAKAQLPPCEVQSAHQYPGGGKAEDMNVGTSSTIPEITQGASRGKGDGVAPRPMESEGSIELAARLQWQLEGDFQKSRERAAISDERIRELMEKVEKQRNAIEALKAEKNGWERRAQGLERDLREAQEEAGRARTELHELKRQFHGMERRLAKNDELLKARANELTVAQLFITTADDFSGADVSHMVTQVNDAIFQCAAMMADDLVDQVIMGNLVEGTAVQELIAAGLNKGLIQRLHQGALVKDTILFEALVKNFLICWCHNIMVSFCHESQEANRLMKDLWGRIVSSIDHKIAKNWLSITHAQLDTEVFDTTPAVQVLKALMLCAGWRETTLESQDATRSVERKVEEIRTKALEIKEVVTRKILSAEVRVFYPPADSRYDPSTMEDPYATGNKAGKTDPEQLIFCSTGLGVEYIVHKSHSSGGQRNSSTILKAQVMLISTAHALPRVSEG